MPGRPCVAVVHQYTLTEAVIKNNIGIL